MLGSSKKPTGLRRAPARIPHPPESAPLKALSQSRRVSPGAYRSPPNQRPCRRPARSWGHPSSPARRLRGTRPGTPQGPPSGFGGRRCQLYSAPKAVTSLAPPPPPSSLHACPDRPATVVGTSLQGATPSLRPQTKTTVPGRSKLTFALSAGTRRKVCEPPPPPSLAAGCTITLK